MNVRLLCLLIVSVFLCCFTVPAHAQTPTQDVNSASESIGSLPSSPGSSSSHGSSKKTVKKGESHTNEDGVTITNDADSRGNATIDPKGGDRDVATDARTKSGFKGTISGIDSNDTVYIASNSTATISGSGGVIEVTSGSEIIVVNDADPATSTDSIEVKLSNGSSVFIEPGMRNRIVA